MRILITGPECTGKTTLAGKLSQRLEIPVLWEYARTYLQDLDRSYEKNDLLDMAQNHVHQLETFPLDQPLILDTYLLNYKIWSSYKYGTVDPWITDRLTKDMAIDLVLLFKPDVPWIQDGLRENREEREEIFEIFLSQIKELKWPFEILDGLFDARIYKAMSLIKNLRTNP